MNSENRNCQNCKKDFTIEPDDFSFYEKIKVPAPTFCPECRRNRRWIWRNERTYYKRKCDVSGHDESIISLYSQDSEHVVYDQKYWFSDKWDQMSYGRNYNFNQSFFEQYNQLLKEIPLVALSNTESVNSEYCSSAAWNKNCYLISAAGWSERVSYANRCFANKESLDLYTVDNCELCYNDSYCNKCYKLSFSYNCSQCVDSSFLYNCKNCTDCFGCSNLRNKKYCLYNKQLSKEDYDKEIKDFSLSSYSNLLKIKDIFKNEIYLKTINKFSELQSCNNSTGDHIQNANNCIECYDFGGTNNENSKYVNLSYNAKNLYDTGPGAGWGSDFIYESLDTNDSSNILGCAVCYNSNDCIYSLNIRGCSNCFGCYGLKMKNYCILNRQYTKEQYEELVPKIIKHMNDMPYIDSKGRIYKYGEFFPYELSPFAYNETIAQEYFPLTKKQAIDQGYKWKDKEDHNYQIDIKNEDIPDNIKDVTEDIVGKVIECKGNEKTQCTEAFKIIPEEFQFYKRMNLPIPHLCPNCRHYERLSQRNPMKLWHRKCMHEGCTNEFETSYAPDRPEIIYCEKCYQQEIY